MKGTVAAGLPTDLWTCPRAVWLIKRGLAVHYHSVHVSRLLRGLGFSPHKSTRHAMERDEERIRAWIEKDWPRGEKMAAAPEGGNPRHMANPACSLPLWCAAPCACVTRLPVVHKRHPRCQKVSVFATLCAGFTGNQFALYFRLHANTNVEAERAMDFHEHLQRQFPIALIPDGFRSSQGRAGQPMHSAPLGTAPTPAAVSPGT